jgi:hypothetical protein
VAAAKNPAPPRIFPRRTQLRPRISAEIRPRRRLADAERFLLELPVGGVLMLRAAPCAALAFAVLLPAVVTAQPADRPPIVPTASISYAPVPLIAPYQWLPAGVDACWRGLRDASLGTVPEAPPAPVPTLLDIRVTPADAVIVVDGQPRTATAGRVVVTVPPGGHMVRVLAPGYSSFTMEIQIDAGHTAPVDVKLVPATD